MKARSPRLYRIRGPKMPGTCPGLGVVAREHLRSVPLPLRDHADVEAGVEELQQVFR